MRAVLRRSRDDAPAAISHSPGSTASACFATSQYENARGAQVATRKRYALLFDDAKSEAAERLN